MVLLFKYVYVVGKYAIIYYSHFCHCHINLKLLQFIKNLSTWNFLLLLLGKIQMVDTHTQNQHTFKGVKCHVLKQQVSSGLKISRTTLFFSDLFHLKIASSLNIIQDLFVLPACLSPFTVLFAACGLCQLKHNGEPKLFPSV